MAEVSAETPRRVSLHTLYVSGVYPVFWPWLKVLNDIYSINWFQEISFIQIKNLKCINGRNTALRASDLHSSPRIRFCHSASLAGQVTQLLCASTSSGVKQGERPLPLLPPSTPGVVKNQMRSTTQKCLASCEIHSWMSNLYNNYHEDSARYCGWCEDM